MSLQKIFELAVNKKASDVHVFVGKPPILRIDGELKSIKSIDDLTKKSAGDLIFSILSDEQKEKFLTSKELDTSFELSGGDRLRVNCFFEKDNPGLVARIIPSKIPSMEEVLLPEIAYDLTRLQRGLVLVTGPTGCGKSTTLAAMIDLINNERSVNIVTLEDPIEFVFKPIKSIIKQRQVGTDTTAFAQGLKHILRQDPNVIMVGEMRDLETIATTLTLAETGHLVFATLHTNNASETIDRVIDVFPPHQQEQIRVQLSMVLSGVIAQQLISRKDGGRIAAREIMIKNSAIANLIRESKTAQIRSVIQTSSSVKMISMDQDLQRLYKEKLIDKETADLYMVDGKTK
ncbi:type IV pilus twitching motility protein PilT [Candidatus Parcubacteria bacterium]|nr:type IV pilus twitching motility protein PilT [Candidatus Parcubacteria bacterium]